MAKLNLIVPEVFGTTSPELLTAPKSPIGWWRVTTEGDEEGRSTTFIGVYYGHIVEIALSVKAPSGFKYEFEAVDKGPPAPTTYTAVRSSARICVVNAPYGNAADSPLAVKWYQEFLNADDVEITAGQYYNCVAVKLKLTTEQENAAIRQKALAKLTPKEKAVLSLSTREIFTI